MYVGTRSVQRVIDDQAVTHVDSDGARARRGIGRPSRPKPIGRGWFVVVRYSGPLEPHRRGLARGNGSSIGCVSGGMGGGVSSVTCAPPPLHLPPRRIRFASW